MRLDIRYHMRFRYQGVVREAHNEMRVRPQDRPGQRLLAHRLTTVPLARVLSFTDYWGTTVDHFGYLPEHDQLEIVAESSVETRPRAPVSSAAVDAFRNADFAIDRAELLRPSPHVEWNSDITVMAHDALSDAGAGDVQAAVAVIVATTRSLLNYQRDSTRIGIGLDELIAGGKGVCQDFTHLTIGLLRVVGIPARYVSGYLFAADETMAGTAGVDGAVDINEAGKGAAGADDSSSPVRVQTHAWVEAAIPGQGWWPVDPTNDWPVGERHVVIGVGRDYDDVAPVRGVYQGDATPEVSATVEIRRMEPVERSMTDRPRRRALVHGPVPAPPDPATAQQQQQQQ